MSQNLERLFALEGGAKRRGAKKGSKKASKGKKVMRGGVPPVKSGLGSFTAVSEKTCEQVQNLLNAEKEQPYCKHNETSNPMGQENILCVEKKKELLKGVKESCNLQGGAKRKSKKASKGSKKASKGSKKAQKGGAKKGSKKASKGKKGSRKH